MHVIYIIFYMMSYPFLVLTTPFPFNLFPNIEAPKAPNNLTI